MNKILTISIILLLTGTFSACKKTWPGKTKVTVTVTEIGSDARVADAKVRLIEFDPGAFMGSPSATLLETFTTDENGCVEFEFDHERKKNYRITVEHDQYYKLPYPANNHDIKTGYKNDIVSELQPEAWLKVYIRNVNNIYSKIKLDSFGMPWGGEFPGYDVDTFSVARVYGNTIRNPAYILVITADNYEKFRYEVYCPAHDTTEYLIEY